MLNIINSFQNKDGYSNPLFQKIYTTNNSKITLLIIILSFLININIAIK